MTQGPVGARATSTTAMLCQVRFLLTGKDTAGQVSLLDMAIHRGACEPLHVHTREAEIVYVLEGEILVLTDGTPETHIAGDCIYLPKGKEHSIGIRSVLARLLVLLIPAGLEGYHMEIERQPRQTQAHIAVQRLIATAARYGVEITGPPPTAEALG